MWMYGGGRRFWGTRYRGSYRFVGYNMDSLLDPRFLVESRALSELKISSASSSLFTCAVCPMPGYSIIRYVLRVDARGVASP